MRLIDVRTIELRWFNDNEIPEYAILSHTWGADEVSYQELVWINRIKAFSASYDTPSSSIASLSSQDDQSSLMLAAMETMLRSSSSFGTNLSCVKEDDLLKRQGYSKIINAAKEAQNLGFKYIWIDTCCIDKSSSAELQEAINSMYRWYKDAEVCIVYLEDVWSPKTGAGELRTASEIAKNAFKTSRWTKRGWTLQELVAPAVPNYVAPEGLGARGAWQTVLKRDYIPDECYDARRGGDVRRDIFVVGDSGVGIGVSIKAGLVGDMIALVVSVDGLIRWH